MSALGQKRTCAAQKVMSALPPKADMCSATRNVRLVPKADMTLLDYIVSTLLELSRHNKAYCLCCLEVDHQLQCSRLHHGKVGRLGPLSICPVYNPTWRYISGRLGP